MGDVEADMVEARRRTDPERPEEFLERHSDRVYRLALRITGVEEGAADAVEDRLRTAAGMLLAFTGESVLASWIYRTVAHASYRKLCPRWRDVHEIALDDVVPSLGSDGRHFESMDDWSNQIDERALQGALRTIMTEAIDALPADYRTAPVLYDVEGASKRDIAEVLGIDAPGVNSRVHRARLFVCKRLSEYFETAAERERLGMSARRCVQAMSSQEKP